MNDIEQRLNKALQLEKHFNPEKIRSVIKSDILSILSSYGEIDKNSCDFDIVILDDASYEVVFKVKLNSIKVFKTF